MDLFRDERTGWLHPVSEIVAISPYKDSKGRFEVRLKHGGIPVSISETTWDRLTDDTTSPTETIIPAAPNTYLLIWQLHKEKDEEAQEFCWRHPVIAWRRTKDEEGEENEPIAADNYFCGFSKCPTRYAIQMPDGRAFSFRSDWTFCSTEEFASKEAFEAAAKQDVEEDEAKSAARRAEREKMA